MNELISGARNKRETSKDVNNYDANMPNLEKHYSFVNFEKYILNSNENIGELRQKILDGSANKLDIRFNMWRLLLKVFIYDQSVEEKTKSLNKTRDDYSVLYNKLMKGENSAKKDPLSRDPGNGIWNNYFETTELKNDIKKDVDRTYQDKDLFSNLKIKNLLTNILFIWSNSNPSISYRQGINEVAASVIFIYFQESIGQKQFDDNQNQSGSDIYFQFNDPKHAEADIYVVFEKIMNGFDHKEMFRPNIQDKTKQQVSLKKTSAILARSVKIQDIYLKIVDIELFKFLKSLEVEFQIFLLRWIRCLFTREFHLEDSFTLWDAMFLEYHDSSQDQLFLMDCIALAMITYVRLQIFEKLEGAMCLQRFLKYPPIENLGSILDTAFKYKQILLNPQVQVEKEEETEDTQIKSTIYFHQTDQIVVQNINQDPQQDKRNLTENLYLHQKVETKQRDNFQEQQNDMVSIPLKDLQVMIESLKDNLPHLYEKYQIYSAFK